MQLLQSAALNFRATVIGPVRRIGRDRLASRGQAPSMVPFYHRVADSHPNAWSISTSAFERHLDYYQAHFDLVDLSTVQTRIREGNAHRSTVTITFDDGYRDNVRFALPALVRRGIPCTYFVCSEHIRSGRPFAHDVDAGQPLAVNDIAELREWADAGIEIGCHTKRHADFSKPHDRAAIADEIFGAKDDLEQMIGRPVRHFAFPYGCRAHLTRAAIDVVREAGFAGYVSAYGDYNLVGDDGFHIRRFHGDPEFSRLLNWLNFDPTKIRPRDS